ncbi:MAG: phage portal protein [Lachnospiraceae bacterium]|nr:phage portal protein [Lachnospiraceae bacterium]
MLRNLIEKVRQVIRRMFGKEKVSDAIGVDISISDSMGRAIDLWTKMYENKSPWLDKETKSCGLAAAVAGELARLVTLELETEITGNDFLNKEYQVLVSSLRRYCEYAAAKGGIAFKPYVSDGHIEIDTVQADRFFPTKFNSRGEVMAAVFVETINSGKKIYTRLEYHRYEKNTYGITNKAYEKYVLDGEETEELGREIPLNTVDEWSNLEPEVMIQNIEKPLFSYFKMPNANNIDDQSPLGVSVYSKAVGGIEEADKQWSRILWEYKGSELSLDVDIQAFKKDIHTGEYELPKGSERLFRMLDFDTDKDKYHVYSPNIRDESLLNGFNAILRRVEFNSGLAYGTLSDPNTVDKTAEEIKASKQRSYSTVSDIQKSLQTALEDLIYAMDVLAQLSGLGGGKKYDIAFNWDDSIIIDKEQELLTMQQDVSSGIIRKELYIAKKYGVTEEEALKMMPKPQQEFNIQEE